MLRIGAPLPDLEHVAQRLPLRDRVPRLLGARLESQHEPSDQRHDERGGDHAPEPVAGRDMRHARARVERGLVVRSEQTPCEHRHHDGQCGAPGGPAQARSAREGAVAVGCAHRRGL